MMTVQEKNTLKERMRRCQLDMLRELKRVCDANGIRFWLDAGSMLGAVRHGGFIPWDDDIDVIMFRRDYDRLVSVAASEFHAPYRFQTAYSEFNFVRGHAQLRDTRTSAIIPEEIYKSFNQGLFIDVFPLDNVYDDEKRMKRTLRRAYGLRRRLEYAAMPLRNYGHDFFRVLKSLLYKCIYPTKRAFNRAYAKYENYFRSIPEGKLVAACAYTRENRRLDRGLFGGTVMLKFEGLDMPVPARYDELLREYYGDDYMTPRQAANDHGNLIIDIDTPSEQKCAELRKERHRK